MLYEVITVRVRSVNDSPYYYIHRNGEAQNLKWMFAAFVDEDGLLHVEATDLGTGRAQRVQVKSTSGLEP